MKHDTLCLLCCGRCACAATWVATTGHHGVLHVAEYTIMHIRSHATSGETLDGGRGERAPGAMRHEAAGVEVVRFQKVPCPRVVYLRLGMHVTRYMILRVFVGACKHERGSCCHLMCPAM